MKWPRSSDLALALYNVWAVPCCVIAERLTALITRLCLIVIGSVVGFMDGIVARPFEWGSKLLSLPACGVYAARESAVVIIGGDDGEYVHTIGKWDIIRACTSGLGRAIALSFSESGYTVFVLYPANLRVASQARSVKATNVSSVSASVPARNSNIHYRRVQLLYLWHRKKERSTHSWGLVAPISLDTESAEQRAHASDTVHAYCLNHSLKLASLIVLPPSAPSVEDTSSRPHSKDTLTAHPAEGLMHSMWKHYTAHSMMEPVLVVEDYVDLLRKASGRVVMLSTCAQPECTGQCERRFITEIALITHVIPAVCAPPTLLDGVQERLSHNLSFILDPLGIRVCSVSVGPLEVSPEGEGDPCPTPKRFE